MADRVRIVDLGKRETTRFQSDEEWLAQFPVKLHPTPEMEASFVAKFIAEQSEEYERLRSLLRAEEDLVSVMVVFDAFLARSGFDPKFSEGEVFSALCKAARS